MEEGAGMMNPLQFEFMREALVVGCLIAASCAVLSCFLVLRGWALMGDAISHAVLPGIVLAYWLGLPLGVGAFGSGLFCAIATGYVKATSRVKEDTVMGVVFTGLFALGLVMMSKTTTDLHLDHILFGNILGLTDAQVIETWCVALPVLLITLTKRRDLLLLGFDPAQARALGLHVRVGHYGLLILLSLAIVTALKAVGLILVVALLVTPGATAHLVTKRLDTMLIVSVASAVLATATGLWIAFVADASPGGCIVLVQGVLFLAAALGSRLSQGSELRS
jgi:manganese/iron transport system permease protein